MAGHSKWHNIKYRKGRQDARKAQLFTKISKEIYAAVRMGGANPETNARLRAAIQKARDIHMPLDNIERTIKKATGELGGAAYEEAIYEGYGPGGVAILVEALTDNRNRTAARIRHLFAKHGGSLGESGCVAYLFAEKGEIVLDRAGADEEAILATALQAGAEDVDIGEEEAVVFAAPEAIDAVRAAFAAAGFSVRSAKVTRVPSVTVPVAGEVAEANLALLEALEDEDDVSEVYANLEIEAEGA
ncbi:MAG: YebC/PmpR family DNA-binding transcriptional regulator [Hydrogenibacillus schlegelii]|nr:YebC/PmpR family DNA-binding transcriptional regulator [Hydrogenibacillus schlegelii]